MLRRATATTLTALSKIQRSHPTTSVLTALSSQTKSFKERPHHNQKRFNKKFRARELDELWEKYYARKQLEQESKAAGPGAVSLQSDAVQLDLSPPSDELVAWGDFELQPFVELMEFPEISYKVSHEELGCGEFPFTDFGRHSHHNFIGHTSENYVGKELGDLLKSNGVAKTEQKEFQNRGGRHVKRTKAKRTLARTRKFAADQRVIRRLLWLIDKRREYEKHFDQLEDSVDDPYAGDDFWMKWQSQQEDETLSTNPAVVQVRR
jgi:hypothetical protein